MGMLYMLCLPEHLFPLAFIHFKALKALIFFDLIQQKN